MEMEKDDQNGKLFEVSDDIDSVLLYNDSTITRNVVIIKHQIPWRVTLRMVGHMHTGTKA